MNHHQALIKTLNTELDLSLPVNLSSENLILDLALLINELIVRDFQKLVFILYRIDVNENKLKRILKENNGENAANTIAELIVERQLQKIKSKKEFGTQANFNDEEKW